MSDADKTLVDGLAAGDPSAFEQLVRRFGARLVAVASRILGNLSDGEDAAQETLISAWRSIGQFDGNSSLYTWLHRIAINRSLARLRTAKPRETSAVDFDAIQEALAEPGLPLEKRVAMRRAIQNALDRLPEELRIVLLLRDVEELSSREVAEKLAIADAAVRQRLHRARAAMAEFLRPELCNGPALTCGGQLDLLLDYIDRALPPELQQPVHSHLESCEPCGRLLETYRITIGVPKAIAELTAADGVREEFVARSLRASRDSTENSARP